MKIVRIAWKTLLELWREPLHLALMLFFPIVLVLFYYVAFGQTRSGGLASYLRVLVVNQDAGDVGAELLAAVQGLEWEGKPVFEIQMLPDEQAARAALLERKAALMLVIPPDLSQAVAGTAQDHSPARPATVTAVGDPGSDTFVFAVSFLEGLVREFSYQAQGGAGMRIATSYEFVPGTGTMSDFDFGVPGTIVFGIMFVIIITPIALVRDSVAGTLQRLRLTHASAADLLLGVTLAQMALMAIQVPITFATALALGFRSNGSLLLAAGVCALLGLAAVGVGLIVACFSRSEGDAVNLASGALVPLVFLSGAVFPMPGVSLFTVGGQDVQAYDLLPTTHGAEALRRIMVLGDGPAAVAYELAGLVILSLAILAVGVVLYQKLQMRR